jgi:hypothetical protein
MAMQATATDAQLILQLYDLRREAELRKARHWFAAAFAPNSADDIIQIIGAFGQESAWFRQVVGYWEMAASLVKHGTLNEELFFDSSGEMWFIFAKIYPFLQDYRAKSGSPSAMKIVEDLALKTEAGKRRLDAMLKLHESRRKK